MLANIEKLVLGFINLASTHTGWSLLSIEKKNILYKFELRSLETLSNQLVTSYDSKLDLIDHKTQLITEQTSDLRFLNSAV